MSHRCTTNTYTHTTGRLKLLCHFNSVTLVFASTQCPSNLIHRKRNHLRLGPWQMFAFHLGYGSFLFFPLMLLPFCSAPALRAFYVHSPHTRRVGCNVWSWLPAHPFSERSVQIAPIAWYLFMVFYSGPYRHSVEPMSTDSWLDEDDLGGKKKTSIV